MNDTPVRAAAKPCPQPPPRLPASVAKALCDELIRDLAQQLRMPGCGR